MRKCWQSTRRPKPGMLRQGSVRVSWRMVVLVWLLPFAARHAEAQGVNEDAPVSLACLQLKQTVRKYVADRQPEAAEAAISVDLAERAESSCAGLLFGNMAAVMSTYGQHAEAERLAARSVSILDRSHAPEDRVLLNPLQILAAARFEQGKTAKAREAFQRMRSVRSDRPEDRAVVHGMAGVFLHAEGRFREAESEYFAAFHAWEQAGRGKTADSAAVLNSLASLYVGESRFDEAERLLDRVLTSFQASQDAVPTDYINLLHLRAVLRTRQGHWREAEQDLRDAVALADREPQLAPAALGSLLADYARVLRKNHRTREAHSIEVRAAGLGIGNTRSSVVDVTELVAKPKAAKK